MASITGTVGDDLILGTSDNDTIEGDAGRDTLQGGAGNDSLLGGAGDDRVFGEAGNDTLVDNIGGDLLNGGDGADSLSGERFTTIFGGAGDDVIRSWNGSRVDAGAGDDLVRIEAQWVNPVAAQPSQMPANVLLGDGNDTVFLMSHLGGTVTGGAGDDIFYVGNTNVDLPFVVVMDQGRDELRYALDPTPHIIAVEDFTPGATGDVLPFGDSLGAVGFTSGVLRVTQSGTDTLVEYDYDGDIDNFATMVVLKNVLASSLTAENFGGSDPHGLERIDFNFLDAATSWNGVDNPFVTGHLVLAQEASTTLVLMDADGGADGVGGAFSLLAQYRDRPVGSFTAADFGGFAPSTQPPGRPTSDVITVTALDYSAAHYIFGGGGNDTITGSQTADAIYGGAGSNVINAGDGADYVFVESDPVQPQVINAGAGDDTVVLVTRGSVTLGEGRDTVRLAALYDTQARVQLIVGDFAGGASGDVFDVVPFLRAQTNWTGGDPFASGHIAMVQDGQDARLMFDADGGGDRFQTLLFLTNGDVGALTADNFAGFDPLGSAGRAWAAETVTGSPADELLRGGLGPDAFVVPAATYDSTLGFAGGRVIVNTAAGGRDFLEGFETLSFQDRVITNTWANATELLVDDVYYFARNPDIFATLVTAHQQNMPWLAAAPDAHFMNFGWREGRDPNAFFDVRGYEAVARAILDPGENPLTNYLNEGARMGFDPSLSFDGQRYLINNPDVAAAGMNPLVHYLLSGQAEGRATYMAVGDVIRPNGFDAQYYLLTNPDVAAVWRQDPYTHYAMFGWREGRDPNAYFDSSYYLEHNPDVAANAIAGGMNPLTHFHHFGFLEGRDPSATFDLDAYFAAHPDIDAANVDPLVHLLTIGVYQNFAEADWIVR